MPPARRLSNRNVKGRGCHKAGYRKDGELFFQLKRAWAGFSRECWINEHETMAELVQRLESDVESDMESRLPEGCQFVFFCHRQVIEESDDLVRQYLNGGESVIAKVYNEEGQEMVSCCGNDYRDFWIVKPGRGQRAAVNTELLRHVSRAEAARLNLGTDHEWRAANPNHNAGDAITRYLTEMANDPAMQQRRIVR